MKTGSARAGRGPPAPRSLRATVGGVPVAKLIVEYDGTDYVGWQLQRNGPSIQAEVERALSALHKATLRVTAAGRTDAGVHALGQVVSVPVERALPVVAYVKGMNALLPPDIAVRDAAVMPDGFDARRDARGKRYRYRIENVSTRAPVSRRFCWQVFRRLDVEAMRTAARPLVGRHDFACFQASDCEAHHAVRELRSSTWPWGRAAASRWWRRPRPS